MAELSLSQKQLDEMQGRASSCKIQVTSKTNAAQVLDPNDDKRQENGQNCNDTTMESTGVEDKIQSLLRIAHQTFNLDKDTVTLVLPKCRSLVLELLEMLSTNGFKLKPVDPIRSKYIKKQKWRVGQAALTDLSQIQRRSAKNTRVHSTSSKLARKLFDFCS